MATYQSSFGHLTECNLATYQSSFGHLSVVILATYQSSFGHLSVVILATYRSSFGHLSIVILATYQPCSRDLAWQQISFGQSSIVIWLQITFGQLSVEDRDCHHPEPLKITATIAQDDERSSLPSLRTIKDHDYHSLISPLG